MAAAARQPVPSLPSPRRVSGLLVVLRWHVGGWGLCCTVVHGVLDLLVLPAAQKLHIPSSCTCSDPGPPLPPPTPLTDGKRYACWRALVAPDRDRAGGPPPSAEQCLSTLRTLRRDGGRWAVIMLRGGHFAAAVFEVEPSRVANTRQADKFGALAHKSAHRYVVRCVILGGRWLLG